MKKFQEILRNELKKLEEKLEEKLREKFSPTPPIIFICWCIIVWLIYMGFTKGS